MPNYKTSFPTIECGAITFPWTENVSFLTKSSVSLAAQAYVGIASGGSDYQAPADKDAYLGNIQFFGTTVPATVHLGYADDVSGTNFVVLLGNYTMGATSVWAEHTDYYAKIPKGKFIVLFNSHASLASIISFNGFVVER